MFKSEYNQIIKEHFDLNDVTTRRYIASLEDAGQEQLLSALSSALYDKIVSKVDEIDFGTIPMSRGDITKVEGFQSTEECITIIRKLVVQYKADPSIVDVVITAIENIKDRKSVFIKGFSMNSELVMVLYNMMVLSIERSVSLMIATCIEYVKDPKSTSPTAALNKVAYQRTMDDLLFRQLINFNSMCKDKSFDKVLDAALKNPPIHEDATFMYGTQDAINGCGDPVASDEPTPGVEEDPTNQSALTPGNTTDLFGDDTADQAPVAVAPDPSAVAPEEPANADLTGDTEIPAPNEFPEDAPNSADDECGVAPSSAVGGDVPTGATNEEEEDIYQVADTEIDADQVDYDNIPSASPVDDVTDSDTAINEEEPEVAPESDNPAPAIPANVNVSLNDPQAANAEYQVDNEAPANCQQEGVMDVLKAGWEKAPTGVKIAVGVAAIAALGYGSFKALGYLLTHTFIPFLRNVIYMHYYTRMKVSDYLAIQADLIEANANELQYSTDTSLNDTQKDKIVKKQLKWVDKLRNWSNKFAIDNKAANNATVKNISDDEKEKKKVAKDNDDDYSIF